ncbi:microtubule-associated tumor suppressor candidate 2-like protein [Nephila pilipes]|uniref:Microtubule-associated tumor suppressor candidate 2-like protein n=1 Tax=Nephila pilipes TaxID=299642 RepID=A0A8X6P031_NEPPI|nr:microtubule-associated tumor suppressor candidate 2-like protein [Nephila pilipes]
MDAHRTDSISISAGVFPAGVAQNNDTCVGAVSKTCIRRGEFRIKSRRLCEQCTRLIENACEVLDLERGPKALESKYLGLSPIVRGRCLEARSLFSPIPPVFPLANLAYAPLSTVLIFFKERWQVLTPSPTSLADGAPSLNPVQEQSGVRGGPLHSKPVRPPLWLSKAELTQEIQRLGTLCEARTKELNRLKMETKHVSVGFDAFASLFKYMVEDMNALSMPMLAEDLKKTLKQLELAKQDLAYYEREVEEMKAHHCQELNDLSNKLFEVFHGEVTELSAKHQEEMNRLQNDHQKQIENVTSNFDSTSKESLAKHEAQVVKLQQELINQREELQLLQEREILDLEEKHAQSTKTLQEHIEQLQKKCAELKQHSMGMEDAMRKDTDTKLQWVTSRKVDLEKEVESLKTVLEMKNKELHTLRVQNLEMEKQLEELPLAREKIKMLQARAEDLEALMEEKTKLERKLSTENQEIRDTYEKESKVNKRLSMENEELLWRIRQAEQTFLSGSFSDVVEYPEDVENGSISPAKSPAPQMMSRSVFFTFMDKEDQISSPRSQYKKILPGFAANYKTSPCKSSKSPPVPSPRRAKSHSEPPQPHSSSTPRKVSKQSSLKQKSAQKRQRSGSDCGKPTGEPSDVTFLSVTGSMASSVSSESSVFGERLLEEHKEQILESLEILREQRSTEGDWNEEGSKEDASNMDSEDMSRSSEFSDPKTYYHMTFPVLKEAGMPDCDIGTTAQAIHSTSEGNSPVDRQTLPMQEVGKKEPESITRSVDNVLEMECDKQSKEQDRWRTI